jgi:anti-sigma-K factor RskA
LESLKEINLKLLDERDVLLRKSEQLREEVRAQLTQQEPQVAALRQVADERRNRLDLLLDPDTRVVALSDPSGLSKAVARIYWNGGRKTGLAKLANLQPVTKTQGKTLEVWVKCESGGFVPAGLGWTDDDGGAVVEVKPAKELPCVDKFAITVESLNGAPFPTGPILLQSP